MNKIRGKIYRKRCINCREYFIFGAHATEVKKRKFCCKKCANLYNAKSNSESKKGKLNPQYKNGLWSVAEKNGSIRIILDAKGHCEICGLEGKIGIIKNSLVIHHIDRDRTNNQIQNLMVVCRKCHWKIHNN